MKKNTEKLSGPDIQTRGVMSRRTVLRGLGALMGLPLLDAMNPAARSVFAADSVVAGSGAAAAKVLPVRMAHIFVPNGVNLAHWTPEQTGSRFELPYILEPLASAKDDLMVLSGLTHDKGRANGDGAGDHARSASVFLTGAQPVKTSGARIRVGESVDQVAARNVGSLTRFPSLELSIEGGGNSGNCDSGYSCAYSNNISWASASTPMAKEVDPRRVFDRLFGGDIAQDVKRQRSVRQRRRASVLDFVLEDARTLQTKLGSSDKRKIDEYFTSVRQVERRVVRVDRIATTAEVEAPESLPESAGARLEYGEHLRLMNDMMVLAFQGDVTRISTCMYARAGSNRNYRQINVPDGHHGLSHHSNRPDRLNKIKEINRFHVEAFAHFLARLKAIQEGEGSLLDNCMILYGSGLSDGNRHNNENLPIVLAGRGGGSLDAGRHVKYEVETPMCNLFLSMLDRMQVSVDHFGDSTGRLGKLTV